MPRIPHDDAWRRFTAKRFFFNECVWADSATRSSSSARTVIAGIAIAAPNVAGKPVSNNGGAPTDVTSGARKDGSIIVTGSGIIGDDVRCNPA